VPAPEPTPEEVEEVLEEETRLVEAMEEAPAEEALGWLERLIEVEEVERPAEAPVPEPEPTPEEVEEVLEEETRLAEAMEEAPVEDLEGYIAAQRTYAEEHPKDRAARLDLGRVLWQAERRVEAIETYDHLIASGKLLDEVIPDLEDYVEQWPDVDMQRVLGDAYVKADRLSDALDIYRRALASL
jgi:tetratricopeptide (TPR) repeat protein